MIDYRPFTDDWLLARSKVKYYGAFPAGFLWRARVLMGLRLDQPMLHICGGKVRDYPYKGFGKLDATLDLDPDCTPDFLQDAREPFPLNKRQADGVLEEWDGVLIDRPYTPTDADRYVPGADKLPKLNQLVKNALQVVRLGGRVVAIDYEWPHPGKLGREVAVIGVFTGRNNRARVFTVFERVA